MSYEDFTIEDLRLNFNIRDKRVYMFDNINPVSPSSWLNQTLAYAKELPVKSEKARSELIITPILLELRAKNNNYFTFYSGDTLPADKEKGLNGECDFMLAKETLSFSINTPIISIVEAKKQNIELGIEQCAAQMLGAKYYNEKHGQPLEKIYGCVTTADIWHFMCLENDDLLIDMNEYFINDLNLLLGVFQYIIDYYKEVLG